MLNCSELFNLIGAYAPNSILRNPEVVLVSLEDASHINSVANDILYFLDFKVHKKIPDIFWEQPVNLLLYNISPQDDYPEKANIFLISSKSDPAEVLDLIRTQFIEEQRLSSYAHHLLNVLASGGSLQRIIDEAFFILGNPIVVIDVGFKIMVTNQETSEFLHDDRSKRLLQNRYLDPEDMKAINFDHIHERVMKSEEPILIQNPYYENNRIISRLLLGNKDAGHIVVVEVMRPFTKMDYKVIALLRDVVVQWLQQDEFSRNSRGFHYEYLIADLLDGKIPMGKELHERFAYIDIKFDPLIYITVVELARSTMYININHVQERLEQLIHHSNSLLYNGQLILITSRRPENALSDEELNRLRLYCQEEHLFCGMSNAFHSVAELPLFYKQALRALDLGVAKENKPSLYVYYDHAIDHLFEQFSEMEYPNVYGHIAARGLIEYDKKNNTDLAYMLYNYLLCERNISITAERMHVHRNTLTYRFKKLEQICELDLDNPYLRQYLIASLHMLLKN